MTARNEGIESLALPNMERRVANMVRFGKIEQIDHATQRVKVRSGNILTTWLPWSAGRAAAGKRRWDPPEIGEQVIVLSQTGDLRQAGVIPGFYQTDYGAPSVNPNKDTTVYSDGTVIEYDRETHTVTVDLGDGNSKITATREQIVLEIGSTSMTMDAAGTVFEGPVTINGLLTYTQGMAGSGGGTTAEITGDFRVTGDVFTHNGKNVGDDHKHSGVQAGAANTGDPI